MRLPRLMTTFFHRRTRSDPEVARLASAPIPSITMHTRPVSDPDVAQISSPRSQSVVDLLVPIAPLSPLALELSSAKQPVPTRPSSQPAHAVSRPQAQTRESTESGERMSSPAPNEQLASLKAALKTERIAREVAEEACAEYAEEVVALREEILQLRRSLFAAVTRNAVRESDAGRAVGVKGASFDSMDTYTDTPPEGVPRDPALLAERDRLRSFVQLMVSVGGHKPVVEAAYKRVSQGEDAEAALVAAIKDAVRQPGSVWRGLLEPVVGPRTPAEYAAQVRCTLDARRQTSDWRRRTMFWKVKAKEDGKNAETVTPSVSAISAVVAAIKEKATDAVNTAAPREAQPQMLHAAVSQEDELTPTASQFVLDMVAHWSEDPLGRSQDASLPASSSSMVLPITMRAPSVSVAVEPPLPTLPSSQSSHSTILSSVSPLRGHQRWRPLSRGQSTRSGSSTSSASTSCGSGEALQQSAVSEASTATAVSSPRRGLPEDLVMLGKGSEMSLVHVMHNDFSRTSYQASTPPTIEFDLVKPESEPQPERKSAEVTGRKGSLGSPEKRSRLPVRMRSGLRVIKRISTTFSISRPTVAEAKETNACATAVGVGVPGTRKSDDSTFRPGVGGEWNGTTRIPGGRRLQMQRFGM